MGSAEMDVGAGEARAWLEIGSAGCGVGAREGVGATTWAGEGMGSSARGVGLRVGEGIWVGVV